MTSKRLQLGAMALAMALRTSRVPFTGDCPRCGRPFKTREALVVHLQQYHKDPPS